MKLIIFFAFLCSVAVAEEKKNLKYKKTQEVNFDEQNIDGVVRSPDGAYLLQKRGVKFTPLYKVEDAMEKNMVDTIFYLK